MKKKDEKINGILNAVIKNVVNKPFDRDAFMKKIKKEEEKITKPADKIIDILKGFDTFTRRKVAEEVGKRLHQLHYGDENKSLSNLVIDSIIDGQVIDYCEDIKKQIRFIAKEQKQNNYEDTSFGDYDNSFKLILESEKKNVYTLECHCGDGYWLIVDDKGRNKIHIREIDEKILKLYKDRKYQLDYVEKLHYSSKLGGVYGDIRDSGYILSFSTDRIYSSETNKNISFIEKQRQFVQNLGSVFSESEERFDYRQEKLERIVK